MLKCLLVKTFLCQIFHVKTEQRHNFTYTADNKNEVIKMQAEKRKRSRLLPEAVHTFVDGYAVYPHRELCAVIKRFKPLQCSHECFLHHITGGVLVCDYFEAGKYTALSVSL